MAIVLDREIGRPTTKDMVIEGPSIGTHRAAYRMVNELFPNMDSLTGYDIRAIKDERRGRRKDIQNLEVEIRNTFPWQRVEMIRALQELQARQFATRIVVNNFERGGVNK